MLQREDDLMKWNHLWKVIEPVWRVVMNKDLRHYIMLVVMDVKKWSYILCQRVSILFESISGSHDLIMWLILVPKQALDIVEDVK